MIAFYRTHFCKYTGYFIDILGLLVMYVNGRHITEFEWEFDTKNGPVRVKLEDTPIKGIRTSTVPYVSNTVEEIDNENCWAYDSLTFRAIQRLCDSGFGIRVEKSHGYIIQFHNRETGDFIEFEHDIPNRELSVELFEANENGTHNTTMTLSFKDDDHI